MNPFEFCLFHEVFVSELDSRSIPICSFPVKTDLEFKLSVKKDFQNGLVFFKKIIVFDSSGAVAPPVWSDHRRAGVK